MSLAILITFGYCTILWLVFFKFKWIQFSITWGIVSLFVGVHVFLMFIIGLRFVTPYSSNAKIVQHTIQLVPRLPEPTLLTDVLVAPDVPVKKGQPLFQFDRRPYEYKIRQLEAEIGAGNSKVAVMRFKVITEQSKVTQSQSSLVSAEAEARILKTDVEAANAKVTRANSELVYDKEQSQRFENLVQQGAGPVEDAQKWVAQVKGGEANVRMAAAEADKAELKYDSQVNGVNTIVVSATARLKEGESSLLEAGASLQEASATVDGLKAQLKLARYYLENTTMVAPEDGHIVNLQVRPGMVAGILRVGGIASFICDDGGYMLATYYTENLKYVRIGQPADVLLGLYPGQIFEGKVDSIWWANGEGQFLPSDIIPTFEPSNPQRPQDQFAVKILLDQRYKTRFPIGALGGAAIYTTSHSGFVALRRISIHMSSWFSWLYPMPF